ncbi:unnamed protein product [Ilex paraguariensis]|uniref:KIB1-4 beta-propeller domain-containing protein n=1 Tax=Ilex paraguariensis TaxID=185542 RepID=A0ABC8S881_9AQUA
MAGSQGFVGSKRRMGILSTDPSQDANNYEVVVIYGGMRTLTSFKSGDEAWTFLDLKEDYLFSDAIYYEGRLHGVTLVKSQEGHLLMAQRILEVNKHDQLHCKTADFKVFRLSYSDGMTKPLWLEIKSLDEQALFLGDNDSLVVLASNFSGCSPNCIHYSDHYFEIGNYVPHCPDDDTGVFNLTVGSFGSHYIPDPEHLTNIEAAEQQEHHHDFNGFYNICKKKTSAHKPSSATPKDEASRGEVYLSH